MYPKPRFKPVEQHPRRVPAFLQLGQCPIRGVEELARCGAEMFGCARQPLLRVQTEILRNVTRPGRLV
jgi:hypothetical protein